MDSIMANHERGMSQLQELQKVFHYTSNPHTLSYMYTPSHTPCHVCTHLLTHLVIYAHTVCMYCHRSLCVQYQLTKMAQRLMMLRLFPRERPFIEMAKSPLLSKVAATLNQGQAGRRRKMGELTITLSTIEGLLLQSWRALGLKIASQIEWKVVVKFDSQVFETPTMNAVDPTSSTTPRLRFSSRGSERDLPRDLANSTTPKSLASLFGPQSPPGSQENSPKNHRSRSSGSQGRMENAEEEDAGGKINEEKKEDSETAKWTTTLLPSRSSRMPPTGSARRTGSQGGVGDAGSSDESTILSQLRFNNISHTFDVYDYGEDVYIELWRKRRAEEGHEEEAELYAFFGASKTAPAPSEEQPAEITTQMSLDDENKVAGTVYRVPPVGVWEAYGRIAVPLASLLLSASSDPHQVAQSSRSTAIDRQTTHRDLSIRDAVHRDGVRAKSQPDAKERNAAEVRADLSLTIVKKVTEQNQPAEQNEPVKPDQSDGLKSRSSEAAKETSGNGRSDVGRRPSLSGGLSVASASRGHLSALTEVKKLEGWFQFYPFSQHAEEMKFVKPNTGYPGLGMKSPGVSLGFAKLKFKVTEFDSRVPSMLACALANFNPPHYVKGLATKLDIQVFESAGERCHLVGHTLPQWIPHLCYLPTFFCSGEDVPTNAAWTTRYGITSAGPPPERSQYLLLFWAVLFCTTVALPPYLIPLGVGMLILAVSAYYKKLPRPARLATLYKPCHAYSGSDVDPNVHAEQLARSLSLRSHKGKEVTKWMGLTSVALSVPRDENPVAPTPAPSLNPAPAATATGSMEGPVSSLIIPKPIVKKSEWGSPFGWMTAQVNDASSYSPSYPLFADDMEESDLHHLRHMGFVVLEVVQICLEALATFTERLKSLFDWTDPRTCSAAWAAVIVLSVQTSLLMYLMTTYIPAIVLRFTFCFVPISLTLMITDPVLMRYFEMEKKLDQLAGSLLEWQPESQLCLRACMNIWDLLYCRGLITTEKRAQCVQKISQAATSGKAQGNGQESVEIITTIPSTISPIQRTAEARVGAMATAALINPRQLIRSESFNALSMLAWFKLVGYAIANSLLSIILAELKYLFYLILRAPDRRELEHRAIAATQYLGVSLRPLMRVRAQTLEAKAKLSGENLDDMGVYFKSVYGQLLKPQSGFWLGAPNVNTIVPPQTSEHETLASKPSQNIGSGMKNLLKGLSFGNADAAGVKIKEMEKEERTTTKDSSKSRGREDSPENVSRRSRSVSMATERDAARARENESIWTNPFDQKSWNLSPWLNGKK